MATHYMQGLEGLQKWHQTGKCSHYRVSNYLWGGSRRIIRKSWSIVPPGRMVSYKQDICRGDPSMRANEVHLWGTFTFWNNVEGRKPPAEGSHFLLRGLIRHPMMGWGELNALEVISSKGNREEAVSHTHPLIGSQGAENDVGSACRKQLSWVA